MKINICISNIYEIDYADYGVAKGNGGASY